MAEQLPFDLPVRAALGREDFFVAQSNELALRQIDDWQNWPGGKLVLIGPEASGKTHLSRVWAQASNARITPAKDLAETDLIALSQGPLVVEDIDAVAGDVEAETLVFHVHNMVLAEGNPLLLSLCMPPALVPFALRDLRSRLDAAALAELGAPDDTLLQAVLLKHFSDRQLNVPATVLNYLVGRMDRSFAQAARIVEVIDAQAMMRKRELTVRFVGEVLRRELDKSPPDQA